MDNDRFDHLARAFGRRSRRALGVLPILGLARKFDLHPYLVEDALAGNGNRHKGKVLCQGHWVRRCNRGMIFNAECSCQCPTGQRLDDECDHCVPFTSCCPDRKLCGGRCIPRNECCDITERTCQKTVKKKGKKKGTKTIDFCVAKPACCPDETKCPIEISGCCTSLLEVCTEFDGCCDVVHDKFTCDGKWCCQPDQKCCPGEGCISKTQCCAAGGSSCPSDPKGCCEAGEQCCPQGCRPASADCCSAGGACGGLVCCDAGEVCTTGSYRGQTRADCCIPNPLELGPCDGVCCGTPSAVSMCCPGLSNPCRAIAVGC